MINLSDIGGLYKSIPENLKDINTEAFMYACDRQIAKLLKCVENVKVWCSIDTLDKKYLDFLASECSALLYESHLEENVKRDLILNSQYWHMKLGTTYALGEILNSVRPDNNTSVSEWFNYGGRPYFFKIITDADMDEVSRNELCRMIEDVKNVRSRLEGFDIFRTILLKLKSCGICITESYANIGWGG